MTKACGIYRNIGKLSESEKDRFMDLLDWYEAETPFSLHCNALDFDEYGNVIFFFEEDLLPKFISNEINSFLYFYDNHA